MVSWFRMHLCFLQAWSMDVVSTLPEALHTQFVTLRVMFLQDAKKKKFVSLALKNQDLYFNTEFKKKCPRFSSTTLNI